MNKQEKMSHETAKKLAEQLLKDPEFQFELRLFIRGIGAHRLREFVSKKQMEMSEQR